MKRLLLSCLAALLLLSAFTAKKKDKPKLPDGFIYIPAGTFVDMELGEKPDKQKVISMPGFHMSKYEITNLQYRQFIEAVSTRSTEEEKQKWVCDSTGWRQVMSYSDPMRDHYHRHPAYNNYPVVNISYEGAMKYCEWLQQKIQKDNPDFAIEVKIPTRQQWIWAAMGGRSQAMFPWGNFYLRNRKGEFLCNFKRVAEHAIYRNRTTGKPEVAEGNFEISSAGGLLEKTIYTANVKSFYPNDYGLYNMCGNASEMISEKGIAMGGSWNDYGGDVQIRAEAKYETSAPTVGFRPIIIATEKSKE